MYWEQNDVKHCSNKNVMKPKEGIDSLACGRVCGSMLGGLGGGKESGWAFPEEEMFEP